MNSQFSSFEPVEPLIDRHKFQILPYAPKLVYVSVQLAEFLILNLYSTRRDFPSVVV